VEQNETYGWPLAGIQTYDARDGGGGCWTMIPAQIKIYLT